MRLLPSSKALIAAIRSFQRTRLEKAERPKFFVAPAVAGVLLSSVIVGGLAGKISCAADDAQKDVTLPEREALEMNDKVIEGLKNRNRPPERYSQNLGRPDFPADYDWDEQSRVITLWREIDRRAAELLPTLVKHMDDDAYCITYAGVSGKWRNNAVGDVCRTVVERNLMPVRIFEKGLAGYSPLPESTSALEEWYSARKDKKLAEIQREVLSILLEHVKTLKNGAIPQDRRKAVEEKISRLLQRIEETGAAISVRTASGDGIDFVNFPKKKHE